MYHVQAIIPKNRLMVSVKGFLKRENIENLKLKIAHEVDKLKTGFDMISDVSELDPKSEIVGGLIKNILDHLNQKGIQQMIRITGAHTIPEIMFDNITREAGIIGTTASSIEEAEKILDKSSQQPI